MKILLASCLLLSVQVYAQSDPGKDDIIEEDGSLGTFRIQTNEDLERANELEEERQEALYDEELENGNVKEKLDETDEDTSDL